MLATTKQLLDEITELETKVTTPQARFAREYAIDGNGTRSYKVAYPKVSLDTAKSTASDILKKLTISNLIAKWKEYYRIDSLGTKEGMVEHLKQMMKEASVLQDIVDKEGNRKKVMVSPEAYKAALSELNKILGVHAATKTEIDFSGAAIVANEKLGDYVEYIKQKNRADKS